jgi:hypothetical protein
MLDAPNDVLGSLSLPILPIRKGGGGIRGFILILVPGSTRANFLSKHCIVDLIYKLHPSNHSTANLSGSMLTMAASNF